MLTPAGVRARAERIWASGRAMRAALGGESLFPWSLPLSPPRGNRLLAGFAAAAAWKRAIEAGAARPGYRLEYLELEHRQLGRQRLPQRLVFDTPEDLGAYLGRNRELARYTELAAEIATRQPGLADWVRERPLQVLAQDRDWPHLLAVLDWFLANPRPGQYLRELAIPGLDGKFIEAHKSLLWQLLDRLLPAAALDTSVCSSARHGFERRFGLRYDQPLIRLRLLDPALAACYGGLDDLSLPLDAFTRLAPPCRRVFVTENKINGLSFPPVPDALVVFGLGYGIEALAGVPWLAARELHYWGDIDSHGFAILSQLRGRFPQVRSLLMDRATLLACRRLWGREPDGKRFIGDLAHLDPAEQALFADLRSDRLAPALRLEQERIPFGRVRAALEALAFGARPLGRP